MTQHDNRGKVALWRPKSGSDKAPRLSGTVVAHRDIRAGETLRIALWDNDSDNERAPILTGKLQDDQKQPASLAEQRRHDHQADDRDWHERDRTGEDIPPWAR